MDKDTAISLCTVEGNVVKLPDTQLDREVYVQVKKALEGIGGKWKGGKIAGFVFNSDPTSLLQNLQGGENINLKKQFQFFPTPKELALELVQISTDFLYIDNPRVLEPSSGHGALCDALKDVYYNFTLTSVELNEDNCKVLESKGYKPINTDFMTMPVKDRFDLIIANPPFTKNQDIDHIRKMYEHLDNGGIIVTLASRHWIHSTKRKETEFRNWLEGKECYREDIEEGTFKESGTNISTVMLVIGK